MFIRTRPQVARPPIWRCCARPLRSDPVVRVAEDARPPMTSQTQNAETIAPPDRAVARAYGLVAAVTCPHCWHAFPPEQILWVAQHGELLGDPLLGPEKPRRFL